MRSIFDLESLQHEAHLIKTTRGEIWINIGDGFYVLRESVKKKKPKICKSKSLYNHTKTVVSRGELIASKSNKTGVLTRVRNPKKLNNIK